MKHAVLILASVLLVSCKREERGFRVSPPSANEAMQGLRISTLIPGPHGTNDPSKGNALELTGDRGTNQPVHNDYEENAYAMSEGSRLFENFNCVGCHSHGGGGMGPPLMDDKWIYGSNPEQIFATIEQGRPNGMPSFRGRIPDAQVWQLAAYVRSMSGLASKSAAPGREDHLSGKKPESSTKTQSPKDSATPKPR
jgi:cytochrome c oxidase cbb3-type subunit 3